MIETAFDYLHMSCLLVFLLLLNSPLNSLGLMCSLRACLRYIRTWISA